MGESETSPFEGGSLVSSSKARDGSNRGVDDTFVKMIALVMLAVAILIVAAVGTWMLLG